MLPIGLILTAGTCGAYAVNASRYNSRFLPGTVINGIEVGEMNLDEAEKAIRASEEDYEIKLRFRGGTEEVLTAKDMKLAYPCGKELGSILSEQNRYSWLAREFSDQTEFTLATKMTYNKKALAGALGALPEMQEGNFTRPLDACLEVTPEQEYLVVPEVEGTELIADTLAKKVGSAVVSGNEVLDVSKIKEAYKEPAIRTDSKELLDRQASLNTLMDTNVTVKMSDGSDRVLNSEITKDWITTAPNGMWFVEEPVVREKAAEWIAGLAKEDDNYGYYRSFASTNYGMQRFDTDSLHGHTLDQAAMTDAVVKLALAGGTGEVQPVYSQFEDNKDPRFGGTYVEVDIWAQRVYYYENYELVYDCNCVTGTEGYRSTPSGIFSIQDKERGRTLNGYSSDGSLAYSAYVSYWMCFYPHYGLHDASWRGSFGGDIYEYDGSHGCVNLPPDEAKMLFNAIEIWTPVIVLREGDNAPEGTKRGNTTWNPPDGGLYYG